MKSRFSVRRVDTDPSGNPQRTLATVESAPAAGNGRLGVSDVFNSTSTTCLVETGPEGRKYSLAHLTLEALPRLDNYRKAGLKRPSLGALHGEDTSGPVSQLSQSKSDIFMSNCSLQSRHIFKCILDQLKV